MRWGDEPRENRRMAGRRRNRLGDGVAEADALFGQAVEIGRRGPLVAVGAQAICPKRVERDENDVLWRGIFRGAGDAQDAESEEGAGRSKRGVQGGFECRVS